MIDETKNSRLQHVYRFKIPMHNNPWIKFSRTNYRQLNLHTDPNDVGVIMEIPPPPRSSYTILSAKTGDLRILNAK